LEGKSLDIRDGELEEVPPAKEGEGVRCSLSPLPPR